MYQVTWDEVNLLFWGLRIARYNDWNWISNNPFSWSMAWLPTHNHSPLSNYLLALPYLFTTDPCIVRLFVELLGVDQQDQSYGQTDFRSLDRALWQNSDVVLSPLEITLRQNNATNAQLRLQILMYTFPDVKNANVLDDSGATAGQWLYLEASNQPSTP